MDNEFIVFIKENYIFIFGIVFSVFGILLLVSILNINLNPVKPETHLIQQVTVETFAERSLADNTENIEQLKLTPVESFCESYLGNSSQLETGCNQLTESSCAEVSCCVFAKKGKLGKCVAGDAYGPTFKTDNNGKMITMDSFYYLGKKY